ncbi:PREDICTED: cyclin-dependent kinase 2-interacting protein isoform X1 [Crocodylus porosus]|uniref:cyclin-dependent kinase 2-interacting protein isoform X1 n=1 Tax=Crocodylus porosus TaxID=8502 RepID=UPI00093A9493|nr:PREDICTED: cyclin-dependent kinase 2-interacting protein isoform X1 [Crocodylus porosus]
MALTTSLLNYCHSAKLFHFLSCHQGRSRENITWTRATMITRFKNNRLEIECENPTQDSGKLSPHYNEELEMYCTELLEILENMKKIQLKMEKLTSTTKGVCDLETYHSGDGNCKAPLFHTWPTSYFYETSLKLSEMYKEELQLKQTIVQEIAHTADEDLMMVYLSSWLYQPYIENSSKLLLESMLLETGHRPI